MPAENEAPPEGSATGQSSTEAAGDGADGGQDELTLAKRRQAGADKARDAAIAERDEARRLLAEARAPKAPTKDDKDSAIDIEAVKRELRAEFDKELADKTSAQEAKFLDAQFPEARKRFPEIVDPVKLTELETVFGEAPKPVGNNQQRTTEAKNIDDMSIAELRASLDNQLSGVLGRS